MKTLKLYSILSILVLLIISCNDKPSKNKNEILDIEKTTTKNTDKEDWLRKVKILNQMKEGETLTTTDPIFTKSKSKTNSNSKYLIDIEEDNTKFKDNNFEYSSYWRKEAYKATKKYIVQEINKKPNCKVTRQGTYNPILVRYIGNRTYSVKFYCEFDCKQGYNNPSNYWVEVYYQGNNSWRGKLLKQRFVN